MACDAETILEQACESQIGCLTSNIQLLIIIAQLLCEINEGGGGGGGAGQIKSYITDPNTEGVVPDDVTEDAIAYSISGSGSMYGWNGSAWV